ncbi:MAG TPA: hypothetical protein VHD56_12275 [Tepidisphaeraceae bacterium]|nr:hypothetical protein [Tepidisphaeraceae bacterium]
MPNFNIETLESRELLAGVTLLIHGLDGNITGWETAVADDIALRIGTPQVSQYVLKISGDSDGDPFVKSFTLQHGPQLKETTTAEAVVKVDWTDVDSGLPFTGDVGDVIADYLLTSHGTMPPLAQLPIHLIGHSRGASVATAISEKLGKAGVWVDQQTYLDPVALPQVLGFGDTPLKIFSNVIFADDYWRTDGKDNFDPDGSYVKGTHQGNLNDIVQKQFIGSAHMSVPAYYDGTINPNAIMDRDEPIFPSWYGNTAAKPPRTSTGFYFSRIRGGARPADGLVPGFGGTATRSSVSSSRKQWANGGGLDVFGGSSFSVGQKLTVRFVHQDSDGPSNVTLFLDSDRNPYNNNVAKVMRRFNFDKTPAMTVAHLSALTAGTAPGKYYVGAYFSDADGHARYAYTTRQITLA